MQQQQQESSEGSPKLLRQDSNNNNNTSSSIMDFVSSPREAITRFLFGYHPKTKRSLSEEVECGDEVSVYPWVKEGADPNELDAYGYSPLLNASVLGRLNAVIELIKNGADVNKKGAFGFAPLHAAAQNGRRDCVAYLLEHGAEINSQNQDNDTAMHLALRANRIEIVNLLLRSGADPQIKGFHDKSVIECAAEVGLEDLAKSLESYRNNATIDEAPENENNNK
jgi:hypothetical protein